MTKYNEVYEREGLGIMNEIINCLWKDEGKRDSVKKKMQSTMRPDHTMSV